MTGSPASSPLLVRLGRGEPVRSILLPPAGGGVGPYLGVAGHLARRGAVHAIRATGLAAGERADDEVPAMVDRYWDVLAHLDPPELLFGWSLGGSLAWELAIRFAEDGHHPAVVLVDSPAVPEPVPESGRAGLRAQILGAAALAVPDAELVERTADAHMTAASAYGAKATYAGPALLVACTRENPEHAAAWRRLGARLSVREVDCGHFEVLHGANLPVVLGHLDEFLTTVQRGEEQR